MYVLFSNKIYSFATNTPLNNGQKGNFRHSRENMYISKKLLLRTVQSLEIVDNIVEIEKKKSSCNHHIPVCNPSKAKK